MLVGNHRDAWTFGAGDPSSGTAGLLEMSRGYGQLLQNGVMVVLLCVNH